jgi:hypothetical protein
MSVLWRVIPSRKPDADPGRPVEECAVFGGREEVSQEKGGAGCRFSEGFSNLLSVPEPERCQYPTRTAWLCGLLLLCMIPRLMMIPRLGSICPDGVLYIHLAKALEEGHFQEGFQDMNLNLYPLVLAGLHRLGIDWAMAGTLWGMGISTLAVLPLFGWVRRQFNDSLALMAGILYAVHPVFIQWAAELIRDPTFWFFFILTLYLFWRAAVEVRWRWFIASGLSLTLAVLTRFEGFLLLIPVVLWAFWRWRALARPADRRRLAGGTLVTVMIFPLLILGVNLVWLQRYDTWIFSRVAPLTLVRYWWHGMVEPATPMPGTPIEIQTGVPLVRMVRIFVPNMIKGLSPLFALLVTGGMIKWRKIWFRRDHQALFITALAMFTAAWIHAWSAHESCERYFLPVVLMGAPFAALSLRALIRWFQSQASRFVWRPLNCRLAGLVPVMAMSVIGISTAFSGPYARRTAEVELARWIRLQFGPQTTLYGSGGVTPVIGFYAQLPWTVLRREMDDPSVIEQVVQLKPDVILVLNTRRKDPRATEELIKQIERLGFRTIESAQLPTGIDRALRVAVRATKNR